MKHLLAGLTLVIILSGCVAVSGNSSTRANTSASAELEYLNSPPYQGLGLPFTEAVKVGNLLFLSGKLGNLEGSRDLIPGGIQPETRLTMEKIQATVERFGSSMDRVVKCTVFLADMAEWGAMNEVYKTFFPNHPPARSALGASGLALGARVEIECIAAL